MQPLMMIVNMLFQVARDGFIKTFMCYRHALLPRYRGLKRSGSTADTYLALLRPAL